jgi:hypothetical protein
VWKIVELLTRLQGGSREEPHMVGEGCSCSGCAATIILGSLQE